MANQEHLDILEQGIGAWNKWRIEYIAARPDLSSVNLRNAYLHGADFWNTDLSDAHLYWAELPGASLIGANLSRANLTCADLSGANLSGANLSNANFSGAKLYGTIFNNALFNNTDFTRAGGLKGTVFAEVDLRGVKGLDTLIHSGPSEIGIRTIYLSRGNIPEVFLREAGIPNSFIEYMNSLVHKPIDFYSCFISYASKNEDFVRRLYADLQARGVRCWFAPEDLKIGDKFRHRIDESIRVYDKLLLVLSEASLASTWVGYEVERALDKEPEGKPNVLFPIRLDKAILTCETDWAKDIRKSRHIGDFEQWKDHDTYQIAFERLLRDLKAQS